MKEYTITLYRENLVLIKHMESAEVVLDEEEYDEMIETLGDEYPMSDDVEQYLEDKGKYIGFDVYKTEESSRTYGDDLEYSYDTIEVEEDDDDDDNDDNDDNDDDQLDEKSSPTAYSDLRESINKLKNKN
jgi:PHD/YefM family antitoxin component YafN of YafNO toxin-antitoxin module